MASYTTSLEITAKPATSAGKDTLTEDNHNTRERLSERYQISVPTIYYKHMKMEESTVLVEVAVSGEMELCLVDHVPVFADDSQMTSWVKSSFFPSSISEKNMILATLFLSPPIRTLSDTANM